MSVLRKAYNKCETNWLWNITAMRKKLPMLDTVLIFYFTRYAEFFFWKISNSYMIKNYQIKSPKDKIISVMTKIHPAWLLYILCVPPFLLIYFFISLWKHDVTWQLLHWFCLLLTNRQHDYSLDLDFLKLHLHSSEIRGLCFMKWPSETL